MSSTAAHWRAVETTHQGEVAALRTIQALAFDFDPRLYWVQIERPATRLRPARTEERPAFPGYIFVRFSLIDPWHTIRRDERKGIAGIVPAVGTADRPGIIADTAIAMLLRMAERNAHTGRLDLLGLERDGCLYPIPRHLADVEDWTDTELEILDVPGLEGETIVCLESRRDRVLAEVNILGVRRKVWFARAKVRPARHSSGPSRP